MAASAAVHAIMSMKLLAVQTEVPAPIKNDLRAIIRNKC
jgi:hypothetical protein